MSRIHTATFALACLCLSTGCGITDSSITLPSTAGRLLQADTTDEYLSTGCEAAKSIAAEANTPGLDHSTDDPCNQSRWDRYARCDN